MTQTLDFSNRDLRNRSFKGQDLAGANFRKADIRGCDFSSANLEGTDFSGVTAGQSRRQIFIWFVAVVVVSVATVSVVLFVYLLTEHPSKVASEFAVTFAGVRVIVSSDTVKAVNVIVVGIVCVIVGGTMGANVREFANDEIGTSFKEAKLTNSKFTGAILNNCNFVNAKIHQIDWTHAYFMRCKFSGYLDNQLIRELCVSRVGANEDFSSMDLSGLNLIGVNLYGATLTYTNLSQTTLSKADLTNTNLCNAQAIKTDFTSANLCGANLAAANLNQTNLSKANLTNTNLCNLQAIKTDFTNANLSGACIENWAITPETNFTNVICSHIFLDFARSERKPASSSLKQGDFAKLVTQSTKSLDFFFRNGIDPQAFDFALNNLVDNYHEMGISLKSVEDFGDGDRIVRFNTVPDAPKGEMHAQFTQVYEEMHQQLEASRNKVWELEQKLDRIDLENKLERFELEKQLAIAIAKLEERPTSQYLQNLVYHQTTQLGQQKLLYAPQSKFGDPMSDKSIQSGGDTFIIGDKNKGVFGKDQQGAAGRDISGTVTNTIQQLRETNQPEAPQLSDLLEQLQKEVENSSELGESDKEKALEYLNQIGNMSAKDPSQKKGMLPILLDAFTGVISKAASLIEPVKKIADAILSIWQA